MEVIPWALFAAAGSSALFFATQWNGIKKAKAPASNAPALEKKIDELRTELTTAKEETQRKQKLLEEVREEAKKKLRRDGKKADRVEEQKGTGMDPRDVEMQGLKKGLASLESQLNQAKAELAQKTAELEHLSGDAKGAVEGAVHAQNEERDRSRTLAEENSNLKRTLEDLRTAMRKDTERPDVPGSTLDLRALPPDAVQELARYFRKGEEFERLYAVAQGQVQLSQDRYGELQRRYFAVCRELALAAGAKPGTDAEAKSAAEGLVTGSDQLARNGRDQTQPRTPGTPGVPGAPGEGRKRRRRRRKRRLPGEATGVPGEALAGGEGDEGDEGDEEGDDALPTAAEGGESDAPAEPAGDDGGTAPVGA
jgi:hypothetical protein